LPIDKLGRKCNIFNLALHFECGYSGIRGLGFGYWGIRIFGIALISISLISKLPNLQTLITQLPDIRFINITKQFKYYKTVSKNTLIFAIMSYNVFLRKGGKEMKKILIVLMFLFLINSISQGAPNMDKTKVVLETNQGLIEIQLMPEIAPKACENFVKLVEKGYYDGIIFHRVIKNFMIQGGDPTGTGSGGESIWGAPFKDEVTQDVQFNKPGILAMANAGPNTNGSQFFITTIVTPWLNMRHTIFGEVVLGYDVVQKIENSSRDPSDKPIVEQKIIKAYLK
jgi:peptidylprolyl isomerase